MTEELAVAPGWYQVQRAADLIRWWDGSSWSRRTEPKPAPVETPVVAGYVAPAQVPAFQVPTYAPEQAAAAAAYVPMQIRMPAQPVISVRRRAAIVIARSADRIRWPGPASWSPWSA